MTKGKIGDERVESSIAKSILADVTEVKTRDDRAEDDEKNKKSLIKIN